MNKNNANEKNNNDNNENNENNDDMISKPQLHIDWTCDHENILIDWADKALCYKWLHHKSHIKYSSKNTWFTIPVIIMSTVTGTANFAQDKIPPEYLSLVTMIIGSVNLIAGILTTIQQFLKITELNESHRVSSIAWGKFYRNVKIEIAKSPAERTPVVQLLKHAKEEFDRLIETSPSLSNEVVKAFIDTFSGGEININSNGEENQLTSKQLNFKELKKPDICGAIEPTALSLYKRKEKVFQPPTGLSSLAIETNINKNKIETFIETFNKEKKRYPTKDEVVDNLDHFIPLDLINMTYINTISNNNIILEFATDDEMV